MASLRPAQATLKRARKSLTRLKNTLTDLQSVRHQDVVMANLRPTGTIGYEYDALPLLDEISAEIGEFAGGSLRPVLDQLVNSLFELRKGYPLPPQSRRQFPICKSENDFRNSIKRGLLEGLTVADIALIESFQLHKKRQWLWELKLVAEEHKHRTLIYVGSRSGIRFTVRPKDEAQTTFVTHAWIAEGTTAVSFPYLTASEIKPPDAMNVDTQIAGPIVFDDGTPAIDKLEILYAEVAYVVDEFEPLFH